jgi:hypothetical protein
VDVDARKEGVIGRKGRHEEDEELFEKKINPSITKILGVNIFI